MSENTRERRLRREASRQGLALEKSRARNPIDPTYGTYRLVNEHTGGLECGDHGNGYGLDLDEIEAALAE